MHLHRAHARPASPQQELAPLPSQPHRDNNTALQQQLPAALLRALRLLLPARQALACEVNAMEKSRMTAATVVSTSWVQKEAQP